MIVLLFVILSLLLVGVLIFWLLVLSTKNRRLQKANQQLEEMNRHNLELIGIISHDLRSPVSNLMTMQKQLLRLLYARNTDKLEKMLEKSLLYTENTFNVLDNILNWTLVHSQLMVFTPESIHLRSIFDEVIFNFDFLLKEKHINLTRDIPGDIYVAMDKNSLKIILRNFIDNSIKYSYSYGKINIKSKAPKRAIHCTITISDKGMGIPKATLENILYTQKAVTGNSAQKVSSGFGLQLCKTLLKKNKSHLSIVSEPKKGTKVTLKVPLYV